jgi:hypothetical protein
MSGNDPTKDLALMVTNLEKTIKTIEKLAKELPQI